MIQQLFTGGHFSSGTRVIQFLMRQTHNIYCKNPDSFEDLDYEPGFGKRPTFAQTVLMGQRPEFPMPVELKEPWALKNPGFMLAIPYLRELFPEAKFVVVVRNGIDQILCNNRCMFERLEPFFQFKETDYLKREMESWNFAYKKALEGKPDLILRLEDLVYDTKKTVQKLVDLTGIPFPDTSMIKKPDSMDRRKKKHTLVLGPDVLRRQTYEEVFYEPSMRKGLYEVGKEMMDYFGYK